VLGMRRTRAMKVYITADVVVVFILIYFALAFAGIVPRPARAGAGQPGAAQIAITGLAAILSAAGLVAAAFWHSAPQRAWLWPVAALPPVLFFLPDVAQFAGFLVKPSSLWMFLFAALILISVVTLAVTAVVSMRQVRAARRG